MEIENVSGHSDGVQDVSFFAAVRGFSFGILQSYLAFSLTVEVD